MPNLSSAIYNNKLPLLELDVICKNDDWLIFGTGRRIRGI